jgi:hypothetical protein
MNDTEFVDGDQRQRIYEKALEEKNNVIWTMRRYYFASKALGLFAIGSEWLTLIFAGVLLYGLRLGQVDPPLMAALSIFIGVIALIKAYHHPQRESKTYYRQGQKFQELYDEVCYFIDLEIMDEDAQHNQLREELELLSQERHELNQDAPQLAGVWYWILKRRLEWVYDPLDMTDNEKERLKQM